MKPIPYGRQSVDEEDVRAVVETLRSDFLTQGPKVPAFEEALAKRCGARHAVAFANGTAALHAAYHAAGLRPGDEFVTSPVTFCATANAGLYLGARPVFADVDPSTGNVDPAAVERAITPRTRMIAPVHFAGNPAGIDAVREIGRRRGIPVVEDACHSLGASDAAGPVGNCLRSDYACLSFHPVKPITTGEGGAVLTNSDAGAAALRRFRTHGITRDPAEFSREPDGDWYYEMVELGYNFRLTDLQAALGLSQLRKLDAFTARRRVIADAYRALLAADDRTSAVRVAPGDAPSWHLYPLLLSDAAAPRRREIFAALRAAGILAQVHYIPVNRLPYYRALGYDEAETPGALRFYGREISLPIFPDLSDDGVAAVVERLTAVLDRLVPRR